MSADRRLLETFQTATSKRVPRTSAVEHRRPERARSVWLRLILVALSVLTLASCKIRIIVPEGGYVGTESGAHHCDSGQTCTIDVTDFFFDETFYASHQKGYAFRFWKHGAGRFCGHSREPCRLLTTIFTGDWVPAILPWLESRVVFYLEPVIVSVDDIIRADGKDWRQPRLFANPPPGDGVSLSWDAVNAVCPVANAGKCTGTLNGHDMNGWTWASPSDLRALFDYYGFDPPSSPPYSYQVIGDAAVDAWLADGWLPIGFDGDEAYFSSNSWMGLTTDSYDDTALGRYGTYGSVGICFSAYRHLPACGQWDGSPARRTGTADATFNAYESITDKGAYSAWLASVGAWFYREAP